MSEKSLLRLLVLALLIMAIGFALVTSCSSKPSIVGKWERIPDPTPTPDPKGADVTDFIAELFGVFGDLMTPLTLEFFDDGKYAGDPISILPGGEYAIVDEDRLRLTTSTGVYVFGFSIDGDVLSLMDDDGNVLVRYRRVK